MYEFLKLGNSRNKNICKSKFLATIFILICIIIVYCVLAYNDLKKQQNENWNEVVKYYNNSQYKEALNKINDINIKWKNNNVIDENIKLSILNDYSKELLSKINELMKNGYFDDAKKLLNEYINYDKNNNQINSILLNFNEDNIKYLIKIKKYDDAKKLIESIYPLNNIKNADNIKVNTILNSYINSKKDYDNLDSNTMYAGYTKNDLLKTYFQKIPTSYSGILKDDICELALILFGTKESWESSFNEKLYNSQIELFTDKCRINPKVGMTKNEVENSTWGKPYKINKTVTTYGTNEQWVYSEDKYIYFNNEYVTAIQE